MYPKVFICHATEDKDRFVRDFGIRMRDNGIEAWVDEWEIAAGDRLTRKIFDEGIKNAKLFIIVLSQFSVEKSWVREELDAAIVKRIEQGTKIVPIVLDNCEVPVVLRATRWIKIDNVNAYDAQFREIVNAVFEHSDKPPLGASPAYINTTLDRLSGLTKVDTLIFKIICEYALEARGRITHKGLLIQPDEVENHVKSQDISHQDFEESLRVLDEERYIELTVASGGSLVHFFLTRGGFEKYLRKYYSEYDSVQQEIIAQIVNQHQTDGQLISSAIIQPYNLVKHVLFSLEEREYIQVFHSMEDTVMIYDVSPRLKRLLKDS